MTPLTDADALRVAQIEARLAAITPGEWYAEGGTGYDTVRVRMPDRPEGDPGVFHASHPLDEQGYIGLVTAWWIRPDKVHSTEVARRNAEFVANAPADLRWLLDKLRAATDGDWVAPY